MKRKTFCFFFMLLAITFGVAVLDSATIKGVVKDKANNKPLESVNVYLKDTKYGSATNSTGHYIISGVSKGKYTIVFSIIGYEPVEKVLSIQEEEVVIVNVLLSSKPIELKEVTVDSRKEEWRQEVNVSSIKIGVKDMDKIPSLLHSDLLRVIQAMPGVVTVGEISTALYVRGGDCDQNLIQLDGVTIFNPFHLGGLFSVFEVDAVEGAEFIAGGFPVKFGNRLSSVLDVTTRPGSSKSFITTAGIGLLYSKLLIEGPFPKGSFLLSARRTYLDKVLPLLNVDFPYYFYDVQSKLSFNFSPHTKAFIATFLSNDLFDFGERKNRIYMWWKNRAGSLCLSHIFSPRLFINNYLTYSEFKFTIDVASGLFNVSDSLGEWAIKSALTYQIDKSQIDIGIDVRRTDFSYKAIFQEGFKYDVYAIPHEATLYWQAKWPLWDKLLLEYGNRLSYFWSEYKRLTEKLHKYYSPAQRVGFKYFLSQDMAFRGACGKYFQFITALIPDEHPAPFIFPWAPIFGRYGPEEGWHYIIGVDKWLSEYATLLIELYYKRFENLLAFNETADPKDFVSNLFHVGDGESYGMDILLKNRAGRITGWLGYSLSRAVVTFEDKTYYPTYDRRHNLNIIGEVELPWKLTFSSKFTYGSGTPYTPVLGYYKYYYIDPRTGKVKWGWKEIRGAKNSARFPNYHRLDVGIEREFKFKGLSSSIVFSIINVYNQRNILMYYYDYSRFPPTKGEIPSLPTIPSLELNFRFL